MDRPPLSKKAKEEQLIQMLNIRVVGNLYSSQQKYQRAMKLKEETRSLLRTVKEWREEREQKILDLATLNETRGLQRVANLQDKAVCGVLNKSQIQERQLLEINRQIGMFRRRELEQRKAEELKLERNRECFDKYMTLIKANRMMAAVIAEDEKVFIKQESLIESLKAQNKDLEDMINAAKSLCLLKHNQKEQMVAVVDSGAALSTDTSEREKDVSKCGKEDSHRYTCNNKDYELESLV